MNSLNGPATEWKKNMISYKNQDIISYMQMKKKNNLTLTCQTRAIIEKNIGINWWSKNKNMANNKQTNLK